MYKEIKAQSEFFTEHATRCKCGHTILITSKDGKELCRYCRKYVFVNKEAELKYRNKEALIKAKRELEENK